MKKVLFIGLVWPEPQSSAAGWRILQLVQFFLDAGSYQVTFASAAKKTPYSYPLAEHGVREESIALNDSTFDTFIADLRPDVVFFDRFMIEEQYGWRVRANYSPAVTILDTEDLHFLRQARQEAVKHKAPVDYFTETAMREIASILRCDLSLIISLREIELLKTVFHVQEDRLCYLPFMEEELTPSVTDQWKGFDERQNFMFIGNFMHEPNWQTVRLLKTEVWPLLRKQLPKAELHIYGSYVGDKALQLHNPKERFLVKGRADDARKTMADYRILLAPIPFGAGAKGKFIDAMQTGTPCVTTSVGAESMLYEGQWNGFVEDDMHTFVEKAIWLYEDSSVWKQAQEKGIQILNENYGKEHFLPPFVLEVKMLMRDYLEVRRENFIGQILQMQQHNSTKYMSLWIEEKRKKNKG